MRKAKDQAPTDPLRDPDIVDRLFAYVLELLPEVARPAVQANEAEIKLGVRAEFGGRHVEYVRNGHEQRRQMVAREVMALFDGRNATEVARKLQISRATVYRIIKQPGARKLSQVAPET